jgi:parvulin-like peptidyl-prolyl isomerase
MKAKFLAAILVVGVFGAKLPELGAQVLVNAVVAEVNERAITLHEVLEAARGPLAGLRREHSGIELQQKTQELLLETVRALVWNALLVQEAERQLSEQEKQRAQLTVDRVVKEMIGTAGSLMNLRQQLEQLGFTLEEEKRRQTEKQMVEMLLEREVKQLVRVRADEVRQYYREHLAEFHQPKEVRIRQILVRYDDYESKEQAREAAEQALGKLRTGGDFVHLAQLYSHGPYAQTGGLWDFMKQGDFIGPIDAAAFSLPQGGLSDVIEGPIGYSIIRVEHIKPERTVPFQEAQAGIQQKLYNQRYQERRRAYLEQLQRRASVDIREQYLQMAIEEALSQVSTQSTAEETTGP